MANETGNVIEIELQEQFGITSFHDLYKNCNTNPVRIITSSKFGFLAAYVYKIRKRLPLPP